MVLIGDSHSGKSSLVTRFADSTFSDTHDPTIGVEYHGPVVKYKGCDVKIQAVRERLRP